MTDRDRLKELVDKAKEEYAGDVTDHTETDYIVETLLNEGVIVPPCKVGDKVYVTFSTFYAEYKVIKVIYDGAFVWAKLVNEEYEPQDKEILRCISFDINKTIFLDESEASRKVKGA